MTLTDGGDTHKDQEVSKDGDRVAKYNLSHQKNLTEFAEPHCRMKSCVDGHRRLRPYIGVKFEPGCQCGGCLLMQRSQRLCQHIPALKTNPLKDGIPFSQRL